MNKATLAVVAFIALAAATAVLLIYAADVPTELTTPTTVSGPVIAYETPDGDHTEWHIHPPTTMQSAERPDTEARDLLLAAAFGVVLVVSVVNVIRRGR